MNIMDLFRTAPVAAPAQPQGPMQVAQPGVPMPGTQASSATAANGLVPTQSQNLNVGQPTEPAEPTPFANFNKVWETVPNPTADSNGAIFQKVDPAKLMESAQSIDFAKVVTPDMLTAMAGGGEGAMKAFQEGMNKVAQTVFAQSALATTKIVDEALIKSREASDARLPSMLKKLSVNDGLSAANPLLQNPAVAPLVSAITEQLVRKNPNATQGEIQSQVNDYFAEFGKVFAPKPAETDASRYAAKAAKAEDWDRFMS